MLLPTKCLLKHISVERGKALKSKIFKRYIYIYLKNRPFLSGPAQQRNFFCGFPKSNVNLLPPFSFQNSFFYLQWGNDESFSVNPELTAILKTKEKNPRKTKIPKIRKNFLKQIMTFCLLSNVNLYLKTYNKKRYLDAFKNSIRKHLS